MVQAMRRHEQRRVLSFLLQFEFHDELRPFAVPASILPAGHYHKAMTEAVVYLETRKPQPLQVSSFRE